MGLMTTDDYLAQLQALLPTGAAWNRDIDSDQTRTLQALAESFAAFDARANGLLEECDPRSAYELLPEWEQAASLPDILYTNAQTIIERRLALENKLTAIGSQSIPALIDLAARLGYIITITEFRPYTVNSPVTLGVQDERWRFLWQVNSADTPTFDATCGSPCNEPLRSWGVELLEAALRKNNHAQTHVTFTYGG